jgi:hypothetical protein
MPARTYTEDAPIEGPVFICPRCDREYPYPVDYGPSIRCECGWWYRNVGHSKIVEEFRPRIGGAKTTGPEKAAD